MKSAIGEWLAIAVLTAVALWSGWGAYRDWRATRRRKSTAAAETTAMSPRSAPMQVSSAEHVHVSRRQPSPHGGRSAEAVQRSLEELAKQERGVAFLEWEAEMLEHFKALTGSTMPNGGRSSVRMDLAQIVQEAVRPAAERNSQALESARKVLERVERYSSLLSLEEGERDQVDAYCAAWKRWEEVNRAEDVSPEEYAGALAQLNAAIPAFRKLVDRELLALHKASAGIVKWGGVASCVFVNCKLPNISFSTEYSNFSTVDKDGKRVIYSVSLRDESDR